MKIKNFLSKVGSWFFIVLTMLGVIIFIVGFGFRGRTTSFAETNWYFVVVGFALLIPAIVYFIKISLSLKKSADEEEDRISELMRNGHKVLVPLDEVEILTNSYQQEIEVGSGRHARLEKVDVDHNVVYLNIPYGEETIKYKLNVFMDPVKLKMHLALKKQTVLYVDSNNPDNCYLDLRFLDTK